MLNRSARLVCVLLLVWVVVLAMSPLAVRAEGLPLDAKKVVEAFEKETAGIRKKADDRTSAAQDKLVKKLRELQVEQTKAGLLDEAVLIRDTVRAIEVDQKAARTSTFDAKVVAKLVAEAQVAIREYEDSVSEISKGVTDDLNNKQSAFNTRLKDLLETYTKAGKLDEALAIRSRISSSPVVVATTGAAPSATPVNLGDAGTDFATVERRYREQMTARLLANRKLYKQAADALVLKLATVLTAHTKAGRLDPAIAIRTFSQSLAAEQDSHKLVELAKAQRPKLPADAIALVDAFIEEATVLQAQAAESVAKLNAAFAPHVEVEARKQLIAGNLEASRQLLTQLFTFRKQDFPFSWAGHYRSTPTLSDKAQPIFDRFAEAKAERLAKANAALEPLRKKWIESLQAALDARPKEDTALVLEQTVELLGSPSTEGLEGLLLFVADNRLPAESLSAWKELRTAVKKAFDDLKASGAEAAKQLATELAPIRDAHITAGEYEAAFIILDRQQNVHLALTPLTVKASPAPGHPFVWDGTVLDTRDGLFLVHYTHRDEWMPRNRFRVGNESEAVSKQMGGAPQQGFVVPRSPFETPTDGPGKPVTEKTKLKVGQRLLAYWGSRWLPVIVVEVAGPKVHWEGYSNSFDEVITRARLRDVSDE